MSIIACSADGCEQPIQRRDWCNKHYRRILKNGPLPPRAGTCGDCGDRFEAPGTGPIAPRCRTCVPKYISEYHRKKNAEEYVPVIQFRTCVDCGLEYQAPGRDTNSLRCRPCRVVEIRRWKNQWEKDNPEKVMTDAKRLRLKANKHRRRVIEKNSRSDNFLAPEIYERDNWECQVCGISIDPRVKFPSRDSASLDHIIPISKGGTHTLDNVQLACMGCNWDKGDRLVA